MSRGTVDFYKQKTWCDAKDGLGVWRLGRIKRKVKTRILVNFDGWSDKWEQWYCLHSELIAPIRMHSKGYTGQTKVALRKMDFSVDSLKTMESKIKLLKHNDLTSLNPYDLTILIRGDLFNPSIELLKVNDFLLSVLELIIKWLQLAPQYYSLQITEPHAYLSDLNSSIYYLGNELIDILISILGLNPRTSKFFDKYKNFTNVKTFITHFINKGGMKALIAITKSEMPIEDIWKLSVNIPSIFSINTTSAYDKYLPEYIDGLIEKLNNIEYESLNMIRESKEELRTFVDNMENIMELIYEDEQKNKVLHFFVQKLKVEPKDSMKFSMVGTQNQINARNQNDMRLPTLHSLTENVAQFQQINPQAAQIQQINFQAAQMQRINFKAAQMQRIDYQTSQIQQINSQKSQIQQIHSQTSQMQQIDSQTSQMQQLNSQTSQIQQIDSQKSQIHQINSQKSQIHQINSKTFQSSIKFPFVEELPSPIRILSIPTPSQVFALSQSVSITPKQRTQFRHNTQNMMLETPDEEFKFELPSNRDSFAYKSSRLSILDSGLSIQESVCNPNESIFQGPNIDSVVSELKYLIETRHKECMDAISTTLNNELSHKTENNYKLDEVFKSHTSCDQQEFAILSSLEYWLNENRIDEALRLVTWRKKILKIAKMNGWSVAREIGKRTLNTLCITSRDLIEGNMRVVLSNANSLDKVVTEE